MKTKVTIFLGLLVTLFCVACTPGQLYVNQLEGEQPVEDLFEDENVVAEEPQINVNVSAPTSCVATTTVDTDADGVTNECDLDDDDDGVPDVDDNCVLTPNPYDANEEQADTDEDDIGDACEEAFDADGDEIADDFDNCVDDANEGQEDRDEDGFGDLCDPNPDHAESELADFAHSLHGVSGVVELESLGHASPMVHSSSGLSATFGTSGMSSSSGTVRPDAILSSSVRVDLMDFVTTHASEVVDSRITLELEFNIAALAAQSSYAYNAVETKPWPLTSGAHSNIFSLSSASNGISKITESNFGLWPFPYSK